MLIWGICIAAVFIAALSYVFDKPQAYDTIPYSTFLGAVDDGAVESMTVQGMDLKGRIKADYAKENKLPTSFETVGPVTDTLQNQLRNNHVILNYKAAEDDSFGKWIPFIVFTFVVLVLVIFLFRQIMGSGKKAMAFGQSKAKLLQDNRKVVTFSDIAGIEEAKEELSEIVSFLKEPAKYTRLGGRIPRGVLLLGQPGTGKTLLARGVAGEAQVPFFSLSGSDFVEMFIGVGASRVRDLFAQAKEHSPCIVFIDEIDAIGRKRGSGNFSQNEEREQTLNQLLVEMDGFEPNENVIIIAATNRPDTLDAALTRPGRFDRRVHVPVPDVKGREAILKIHTRKTPLGDDVKLKTIAKGTPGFSGADLENLVNEAALQAARNDKTKLYNADFEFAKDKIIMGTERRSAVMTDASKRVTAFHEAGHALVALTLPGTDPIHKVSIIPRGLSLGVTQMLPDEDRYATSKDFAIKRLAVMMGGRAAEKIVFDQRTTGAGNDIEVATDLARQMVCSWGMSDAIGPVAYHPSRMNPFDFSGGASNHPFSEKIAQTIDAEVAELLHNANLQAETIIKENRKSLDLIAEALMEFETIDRTDIEKLLEDHDLGALRSHREELERALTESEAAARRADDEDESAEGSMLSDTVRTEADEQMLDEGATDGDGEEQDKDDADGTCQTKSATDPDNTDLDDLGESRDDAAGGKDDAETAGDEDADEDAEESSEDESEGSSNSQQLRSSNDTPFMTSATLKEAADDEPRTRFATPKIDQRRPFSSTLFAAKPGTQDALNELINGMERDGVATDDAATESSDSEKEASSSILDAEKEEPTHHTENGMKRAEREDDDATADKKDESQT